MTGEAVGDNQIRFSYTGEGDAASTVYSQRCPSMLSIMDAISKTTFTLTTSSLLAPVDMKLTDSSSAANYMVWKL